MSQKFEKLKTLLRELFQLDQPDLDFGLYRIMHAKSAEVTQFLDKDLLPQVKEAFGLYKTADKAELEKELGKAIEQARSLGADPETLPKVKELRAKLAHDAVDIGGLENEVYDQLFSFFRRYYSEGDFLAKRVYRPGVYAIPYEGEEVKLHWANRDQYYIKTSEYLRDYAFRLRPDDVKAPMRVHFRLTDAAEGEHGNIKSTEGKDRVFILASKDFIAEEDGDLFLRFTYRPATLSDWPDGERESKKKPPSQKDLTALAVGSILGLGDGAFTAWIAELAKPHLTVSGEIPGHSRLEGHLKRYTARNTFDYFIHKDLGSFLRRELDFYVKNEVMHLDDIENESAARVEQYLSKIKVIRRIAGKVIDFLAQMEDFQRKLWLKKKLVVGTSYCITLDRIPEGFYPQIASNDGQRKAWVRLFAIDRLEGYGEPLSTDFLKVNPTLPLDTSFFDDAAEARMVGALEDLDQSVSGIMIHADNFHALTLARRRFSDVIKSIYIDPPYNTDSSSIPYKNNYKHSSFATLMRDRIAACHPLLRQDGAIFVSIDKTERTILEHALDEVFGAENHIEELIWTQATANSQLPNYSTNHEYVEVYASDRASVEADKAMFREPKPGFSEVMELVGTLDADYPSLADVSKALQTLFEKHKEEYRAEVEGTGQEWDADAKRQDPWRGLYPYNRAEYRDAAGSYVPEEEARQCKAKLWVWREMPTGAPASKQSPTTKDPNHPNYRYYKPVHPVTGKPCPHPQTGWKFPEKPDKNNADRRSFETLDAEKRIAWGEDEVKIPQTKGFLHEVETNIGTSVFYEYNDGEAELGNLFGESGLFLSPKSSKFVKKFVLQSTKADSWFSDFFGGSGSSAHAVVQANREDGGKRKFLTVEMGHYFDTLTKPRILKALYASDWKGGAPRSHDGVSAVVKIVRLESYEDALNNLVSVRSVRQDDLLSSVEAQGADGLKEQYMLRYMLDVETRGSQSLLNVRAFADPTAYRLKVKRPGSDESSDVNVDLLETFNWLVGLTVQGIAVPQSFAAEFERDSEGRLGLKGRLHQDGDGPWWFRTVTGTTPDGRRTLIIWRKLTGNVEQDNLVLDTWFTRAGYSAKDSEFGLIYVNGDNNLENLKTADDTWKVRLIEEDFHRLMFDTEGL
ncbi:site-specific DNA-methyltransferase [Mesorhizobium sp. B2-4-11]|uniref:DNA methyltransferase n=1 Tax=Mesorhizobium sp. B2-4-11 TaxID=2589938 RepID=UPI00112771EC|nr:site-specific DNA-methyltransferase [Mesorhizobium sp. B2-4-11]TPL03517.1 site-specific DNA-methyltransferase [Mesorhizobium sp. B2-4-11]